MSQRFFTCRHLLPIFVLFTTSISVGENAAAGQTPVPAAVSAEACLAGRWRGTWHSDSTDHKGPMQASFECAGPGRWRVVFRGRFCALIPFQYSAVLSEQRNADGTVTLSGSRNLGPLFGTFHFRGTVSYGQLNARWWSKKESGSFVLAK